MSNENLSIEIPYSDEVPGSLHEIFTNRYEGSDNPRRISTDYEAKVFQQPLDNPENPAAYVFQEVDGELKASIDDVANDSANFRLNVLNADEHVDDLSKAGSILDGLQSDKSADVKYAKPILHQNVEALVGESVLHELEDKGVSAYIHIGRDSENHVKEDVAEKLVYDAASGNFEYVVEDRASEARERVDDMNPNFHGQDYEVHNVDETEQTIREEEVRDALREVGLEVK